MQCTCARPEVEILDPAGDDGWDRLLASNSQSVFFHTSAWARVLSQTYGYRPCYAVVRAGDRLLGLLAMMEVRGLFGAPRGVSLPFTDYCPLVAVNETVREHLVHSVLEYARARHWESMEIRGRYDPAATASTSFYRHILPLGMGTDRLFSALAANTRRNIRKAAREGVEVRMSTSLEAVDEYYRLHCMTRKRHGVPPQSRAFFHKIQEHILSAQMGTVALARYEGRNIAGSVFFGFNGKAVYKFGASDYACQHVRPADRVMWEGIRFYAEAGCDSFCFGRTEMDNDGLCQFKRRWGADEQVIDYFKYDMQRDAFVGESSPMTDVHHRVLKRMPIPLLRMVGSLLYKHMG